MQEVIDFVDNIASLKKDWYNELINKLELEDEVEKGNIRIDVKPEYTQFTIKKLDIEKMGRLLVCSNTFYLLKQPNGKIETCGYNNGFKVRFFDCAFLD